MRSISRHSSRRAEDRELARRVGAGDGEALEAVMRRHNRRLYRIARAALRDPVEAEDALQDAYLAAFRSSGQFRGEASLGTWLSRVVLNQCLSRVRRTARRDVVVPLGFGPEHDDAADRKVGRAELRALLEQKIDALPESYRLVFVLRSVEDMSVEETARALGVPEATVRSRYFRARALLRESLAAELDLAERDVFDFGGERCDRVVAGVLAAIGSKTVRAR